MKSDCSCNLTFNKCDAMCCCDNECDTELVTLWTDNNVCISSGI